MLCRVEAGEACFYRVTMEQRAWRRGHGRGGVLGTRRGREGRGPVQLVMADVKVASAWQMGAREGR